MTKQEKDQLFEKEFLPLIDALYTFAFHLTYEENDANDLVQETYLNAYRFIEKYDKGTNAKAWLFKILKNNFINQYRKKSKLPDRVELDKAILVNDSGKSNSTPVFDLREEYYNSLMGDEVTFALNKLPFDFRTAILLCDLESFSYEEISKILEIPIGTVRSRLHRARNMLKEMLQEYGESLGFTDQRKKN